MHFYIVGVLVNSTVVYILYQSYVNGSPSPMWYTDLIEFFTTSNQIHISKYRSCQICLSTGSFCIKAILMSLSRHPFSRSHTHLQHLAITRTRLKMV